MTRKLEELFDLPTGDEESPVDVPLSVAETQSALEEINHVVDKIEAALPTVRGLDTGDEELDELARLAVDSYRDLTDLGMNIDSRYASEIFAVAGTMLGHALTAKTAKLNKKLKMIDLQLKKARLDQDRSEDEPAAQGQGQVLSRNDLLERILGNRSQNHKTE
jgi:hypothetical protein